MIGYEVRLQVESGISLTTTRPWAGWRIRYRRDGTRPWRSFLLTVEGGGPPTDAMVEQAIRAHEESGAGR